MSRVKCMRAGSSSSRSRLALDRSMPPCQSQTEDLVDAVEEEFDAIKTVHSSAPPRAARPSSRLVDLAATSKLHARRQKSNDLIHRALLCLRDCALPVVSAALLLFAVFPPSAQALSAYGRAAHRAARRTVLLDPRPVDASGLAPGD